MNKKYPYFGKHIESDRIIHFTERNTGTVIEKGRGNWEPGYKCNGWDESMYVTVNYPAIQPNWTLADAVAEPNIRTITPKEASPVAKETVLKKGDIIIGSITKDTKEFSATPHPYVYPASATNQTDAKEEAIRLAKEYPNKKFVMLRAIGTVTMNDIIWE